jgi:hypothetical protein
MKKTAGTFGIVGLVALLAVAGTLSHRAVAGSVEEIGIVVSPSCLALDSQGTWVTVHADIPYYIVAGATVTLNGIEVEWTKSDNRGDFVAKFRLDDVKSIVEPPSATLVLEGETKEGVPFTGSDEVRVID